MSCNGEEGGWVRAWVGGWVGRGDARREGELIEKRRERGESTQPPHPPTYLPTLRMKGGNCSPVVKPR